MSEHQERADELERELLDMEHRTEKLEDQISETRDEWERKQRDHRVPGATGEPTSDEPEAESDDLTEEEEPEAQAGDEDDEEPEAQAGEEDEEPEAQAGDEDEARSDG